MDAIGWYIATLHDLIGHDQAAAFIGQPPGGDQESCLLCQHQQEPNDVTRQAVIRALRPAAIDAE
jgi:hypothetical protein